MTQPRVAPVPIILESPHSGEDFALIPDLNPAIEPYLHTMCDKAVDVIWAPATHYGATMVHAHFPKAFVDVNRSLDDIQPWPGLEQWSYGFKDGSCYNRNNRLFKSGITVADAGRAFIPLSHSKLSLDDAHRRVDHYYKPYRRNLQNMVQATHRQHGTALHISCHSMRSTRTDCPGDRYDVILGDHNGQACAPNITQTAYDFFTAQGLKTALNYQFNGGNLLTLTRDPQNDFHSLQIELSKRLYMDEATGMVKHKPMQKLQQVCSKLIPCLTAQLS